MSIGNRRFGCSWCGHVVKLDYDVPVANEAHMPFNYCPNCSAEVVEDV
nr:MAG TPA: DNA directed RNA polymerase, 7 kDa subunit [Caudoviricetes sp.]